jgi:hypothetical protein
MTTDWTRLSINSVIVHEVPKRLPGMPPGSMTLSQVESPLDQGLKTFLVNKLVQTMVKAFCARLVAGSTSPTPALIEDALGPRTIPFVTMSQQLANHLYSCQNGSNPAGLLTVIAADLGTKPVLAIAKLEKEEAIRLHQRMVGGQPTFDLQQLRDLVLGDKTKVFKAGIFQPGSQTPEISADVSDTQVNYQATKQMADFFLKDFLGCDYCVEPERVTELFWDASEKFVNSAVEDPLLKSRYEQAIMSDLLSADHVVEPRIFARRHLHEDDRDPFLEALDSAGVPKETFPKDLARIRPHLEKVQYKFDRGTTVTVPLSIHDDIAKLELLADGRSQLTITDLLEQVRGRS